VLLGNWPQVGARVILIIMIPVSADAAAASAVANQVAQCVSDLAITVDSGVLIDQRCSHAAVSHAMHQLTRGSTGIRSQLITSVAQIVEVKTLGQCDFSYGLGPIRGATKVASSEHSSLLATED